MGTEKNPSIKREKNCIVAADENWCGLMGDGPMNKEAVLDNGTVCVKRWSALSSRIHWQGHERGLSVNYMTV